MAEAAIKYVNTIRNERKREYARAYRLWLVFGKCGPEPQAGKLSSMAAQAVRNRLADILAATDNELAADMAAASSQIDFDREEQSR